MDPLDKSQVIRLDDIPSPQDHAQEVRRIFVTCGVFSAVLFLVAVTVVGIAVWRGVPLQTIAFIVPIVMGIGIVTFFVAYAMPVGLVSLKRLEIAYKMGYFGMNQNREAVDAMKEIARKLRKDTEPLPVGSRRVIED